MKKNSYLKDVSRQSYTMLGGFLVAVFIAGSFHVFAASVCITNPNGNPPDDIRDNRCSVTAEITPDTVEAPYGSSVNVRLYGTTIAQYDENAFEDVDASMTAVNSGTQTVFLEGLSVPSGRLDQIVSTGPLSESVTLTIFIMSMQGVVDTDSSYITVTGGSQAPTVNLYFSIVQKLKNFLSETFSGTAFAA